MRLRTKIAGAVLAASLTAEGFSSLSFDPTPSVISAHNSSTPDTAIAILGGAGMPQEQIDEEVRKVLRRKGNNLEFVYSQTAFDKGVVVNYVLDQLKEYPYVTFYVLSMGGMIAYDVIQEARRRGDTRRFGLIMVDSPSSGDDVQMHTWGPVDAALKAASCLPWGVFSNLVLSPPTPKGDLSQAHPRDPEELKALWKKYGEYGWSGASAQACYVFRHDPLRKLEGVDAVYIRSTKDAFVKDSSIEGWKAAVDLSEGRILHVDADHISLMDEPDAYERATKKAFDLIG